MQNQSQSVILVLSFILLTVLKSHEQRHLNLFFKTDKTYKLNNFAQAKYHRSEADLEKIELWESMLTGRSAPVSKWIKEQYKDLGLNHLFTPSGFHLSAALWPFLKIFNKNKSQLFILIIIGIFIFSLTGLGALKRMVLIKGHQKILGQKTGFIVALLLDILWGTFSHSPLSFAYSFLFLGLIYFGKKMLFLWFFFAQIIIAFFSGASLSPLMLFLSPTLNLAFAFAMPLLLILAIPLWDWQLNTGLLIISGLQTMVKWSGTLISFFPRWEIHGGILVCLLLFYFSRRRALALALLLLTQNLNVDQERFPSSDRFEYVPKGHPAKIIHKEKETVVYFKQGKCRMRLIRGQWWEKCSPPRRSTKIKS